MELSNPFYPSETEYIPCAFAGRSEAYSIINKHLADPNNAKAAAFVGRRHIGKSALLWHFDDVFPNTFIGVYISLKQVLSSDENENYFFLKLVQLIRQAVIKQDLTTGRIPTDREANEQINLRGWFANNFLPEVFHTIRAHRRLVLLIDDMDILIQQVERGVIDQSLFPYFSNTLKQHGQLGMTFTINDNMSDYIDLLSPLVELPDLIRLDNLPIEETSLLMRIPTEYNVSDDAIAQIHKATGGHPLLLQRFGYHLYAHVIENQLINSELSTEIIRQITPAVIADSSVMFREIWNELSLNERLVLTAISNLNYLDPLGSISPETIEKWLVETDYPMDETTIKAAIRGLEFRSITQHKKDSIQTAAGILQIWLLNNAQIDTKPESGRPIWVQLVVMLLVVMILIISMMLLIRSNNGRTPEIFEENAPPTVTLETP